MQSTSNQFKTAVKNSGRHFKSYVMINGTKYESIDGMEIKYGIIQGDDIGIGNCYISSLSITLKGVTTTPKFLGQKIIPYIGLQLDDTGTNFEYLKMGVFKVQTANVVDRSIVITANDNMQLANVGFFSNLKGNQKITAIMNEQCQKLGISFVGGADDVAIDVSKLEGLKIIEAMSLMSAYCGKNAIANREGNIEFKWFNDVTYEIGPNRYPSPLTVGEKDFVVNGVSCVVDKDTTLSSGLTTGKVISISNQFMTQARLDTIFNKVKNFAYRTCNLTYTMCDPSLEVGDIVTIKDVKGNKYKVPLFNFSVKFTGGCAGAIECFGKTDEQKSNQNGGFLSKKVERNYTEYISTKVLLADTIVAYDGKFGKVETDYLQVNVEISALSGKFGTISSDLANFKVTNTEQLNAINAKINTLETVDLKAITATIAQANIDIGKINTLLAGTVTAGSGQYIVLNAQNTVISNALIKSAMIDTLDFNKITGVDINTTNLKIHSKDGMSQWMDNTIQIKDANRQRVQIGKDASGDYNIYVWDKVGKLMFDATGVTADGIQKPIIRDDMVATNANISGDKLNITSVITKINANSTLIESSHIKYDGKTLDVAFNSLQTTVENIDIGGRNLLLKSGSTLTNNSYLIGYYKLGDAKPKEGDQCTITIKGSLGTGKTYFRLYNTGGNVPMAEIYPIEFIDGIASKPFIWRIKNNGNTASNTELHVYAMPNTVTGVTSTIEWIRLDFGNKAPRIWTPAPEDTDGQITTLTESIKSQSTQISVAQGQIGTLITDVSQSKSDIATVKGGLVTATGNISTLQSNYSTLNQTVSGLSATVGSHTSSITTLTGTANTALTNANNANSKIDGLEIGGVNLIRNSVNLNKNDVIFLEIPTATNLADLVGEKVVISFNVKVNKNPTILRVYPYQFHGLSIETETKLTLTNTSKFERVSVVAVVFDRGITNQSFTKGAIGLYIDGTNTFSVNDVQVERGTKATDYNKSPKDIENSITSISDKQTTFEATLNGITGRVSSVETVTKVVTDNKVNWDKAPTALSTANTANSLANTNKTNLANLTTTVTETKTAVSNLQLDYNGFKTTVSETYTTKTEFDALQIGGRNLLRFTGDLRKGSATSPDSATGINIWTGATGTLTDTTEGLKLTRNGSTNDSFWIPIASLGCVENGKLVTLSFKYRTNTTNTGSFYFIQSSGANISIPMPALTISETEWKEFKWTFSNTQANIRVFKSVLLFYGQSATGQWIEIKKGTLQLEKGSKATDWTPANEDVDGKIDGIQIGGRNLLKYTDFTTLKTDYWLLNLKNYTVNVADPFGTKKAIRLTVKEANSYLLVQGAKQSFPELKEYTVSVWMRANKTGKVRMSIGEDAADGTKSVYNDVTTAWKQYSLTVKVTKTTPVYCFIIGGWSSWTDLALEVDVAFPMLIAGNKPMDWSPSPDDIDEELSSITQTANNITLAVSKKVDKDSIVSSINQTAETVKIDASKINLSGYVTIENAQQRIRQIVDLSGASYNQNTFYPVVGTMIPYTGYSLFELNVQLNSGTKPTWSTHASGFACNITARMKASGWGTVNVSTLGWIDDFSANHCDQMPAYITQMSNASLPVFYLRGGGKYYIYTDYICNWSIKTATYTASSESVSPIVLPNKPTNLSFLANNWTNDKAIGTWCYNNDVTFIDGGKIYTGTITAEKIKATTLSAISANLGSVTAGSINIGSGKFVVDSAGNLTANNAKIEGTINATSGSIGDFVIMSGAITSGYTTSGGRLENYLTLNKTMFEVVLTGVGNARCAYNYIGVTATSTNSSKTTWMDGNQIFTNGSITANEYNTVHGNEIVFNSSSNGIYFGYRPGSNGNKVNTWIFCNGTNVATGNGTIECGDITAKGSAWIGWQCASGGDWFGFYNGSHGTRQGWIGHNSSNDFNFTNEKSGNFVFNRAVRATGLYNTNIGAWTTHSNNIDLFTDIKDYFEIRGPGYAKGIYYTVSDIKFKKDVMPTDVNNAMDIINQLEHVQFNWIDGGKHVDIGYIANDVRDIMEGLTFNVKQPDGSDQYNINQTTFLPLVTKGMQELSKTLDTHDDRLTELEKENESLKLALSKEIQLRIDLEGRFNQLRTTI